jgi:hypothetical protein
MDVRDKKSTHGHPWIKKNPRTAIVWYEAESTDTHCPAAKWMVDVQLNEICRRSVGNAVNFFYRRIGFVKIQVICN